MSDEYYYRNERLRGYSAGKMTATLEFVEVILQHLLAGNNRAELEFDVNSKLKELVVHAKDMRKETFGLRSNISVEGRTKMHSLLGRIDGVYDVISSIKSVAEFAQKDRQRHG